MDELQKVEIRSQGIPPKPKTQDSFFTELFKFTLVAIVIVLPIRLFIAQPFIVSGSSMDPTFENGEYLIVDEVSYRFTEPERGEVIIFRYPRNPSKFFIKRIVGLPGETLTIHEGSVKIVNEGNPDGFELSEPYIQNFSLDNASVNLGPTEYFVLGDNRAASSDSRVWGPLDSDLIVGKALMRLFPVERLGILPGEFVADN